MANKIMDYSQLYNPQICGDFLEVIRKDKSRNTYISYYRHLTKISNYEKIMNKNIYEFGRDEDIAMLKYLWIESPKTANPIVTVCKQYVDYALLVRGLGQGNINHFNSIKFEEVKGTVKHSLHADKYITYNEYRTIINQIDEDMDKVPIILAWNGIIGKSSSDIIEMKKQNLDRETNTITVPSTGEIKQITPVEMEFLFLALEQETYRGKMRIIKSDYLIRPTRGYGKRAKVTKEKCARNTINSRVWTALKDIILDGGDSSNNDENKKSNSVSLTTIFHSRVAWNIIEKEKQIGREITSFSELKDILRGYGIHSQVYTIKNAIKFIKEKLKEEEEQKKEFQKNLVEKQDTQKES